jgi:hypothetical protein
VTSRYDYASVWPSRAGCTIDADTWMSKTNVNLVWSYVLYDGVRFETNALGKARWKLAQPVEWYQNRKAP